MSLDKKIVELVTGPVGIAFATIFGALSFIGILTRLANLPEQLEIIVEAWQWVTHGVLDNSIFLPLKILSISIPGWLKDYTALSLIIGGAFFRSGKSLDLSPRRIFENVKSFRSTLNAKTYFYGSRIIQRMLAIDNLTGPFANITVKEKWKSYLISILLWPVYVIALIPFAIFSKRVNAEMEKVRKRRQDAYARNKKVEEEAKTPQEMMAYAYMMKHSESDVAIDEIRSEYFHENFASKRLIVFHLTAVPALAIVLICLFFGLSRFF